MKQMRRKDRAIDIKETMELIKTAEYGFLATAGEDIQPYCIPISYVYHDNYIYFHCANAGYKIDNINFNNKVCFSIAGETSPIYDKGFTTYYKSAVIFGKAQKVEDNDEKRNALYKLCEKYLPEHMDKAEEDINRSFNITAVYKIIISEISGKSKRMKS